MKIEFGIRPDPPATRRLREIEIGTVFTGNIGPESGPFLRTYDGIVSLSDPHGTWNQPETTVVDYRARSAHLVIED